MRFALAFLAVAVLVTSASAADFSYTGFSFNLFPTAGGAFDSNHGTLWFHEHYQGRMLEYNVDGTPTGAVVSTPGDPDMHGLAYSPITDTFWASASGDNLVWEFTRAGAPLGNFMAATSDQTGLTVDTATGNIYWTSYSYGAIIEYTTTGTQVRVFGSTASPLSLEYLGYSATILISDQNGAILTERALNGTLLDTWDMGALVGTSVRIRGMAYDSMNCNLYIANENDNRVYELHDFGCATTAVQPTTWGRIKAMF